MTDIELEDGQSTYNTNRPNIGAYVSLGTKFIDVVWRGSIEIPLANTKDKLQIILKETGDNERKLGSLSIPTKLFSEIEKNKTYSHWVTLFDFIEDDEYDGDLGTNDEERPRAYIRYSLTGEASSTYVKKTATTTQRSTREDKKESMRQTVTTTKTITSNYSNEAPRDIRSSNAFRGETQYQREPEPEVLGVSAQTRDISKDVLPQSSEEADRYSVRALEGDLRADARELKGELKEHQKECFAQEDNRSKTLAHLEKLHKELQGEHVHDQTTGFQLTRKEADILKDHEVRRAGFKCQQGVIKNNISIVDEHTAEVEKVHSSAKTRNQEVGEKAGRIEDIKTKGLTPDSVNLRAENQTLRRDRGTNSTNLTSEKNDTTRFVDSHNEVINQYNATLDKYNQLLSDVENARTDAQRESNSVKAGISVERYNGVVLSKALEDTSNLSSSLHNSADALKKQLSSLESKYKLFLGHLSSITSDQEKEAQQLQGRLRSSGEEVKILTEELTSQNKVISGLHEEVDNANATNLNSRLRKLIDNLVTVDGKRRLAQEGLENAQTSWSIKLHLFLDEASRNSREAARQKRIHEVEKQINKIDQINREIYRLRTEYERMDKKAFTDANRDLTGRELKKELEGITLKLRWADEERRHSFNELETLLNLLRECDIREMQESEISSLRDEITSIKRTLEEYRRIIIALEDEIAQADRKINDLQRQIDNVNAEIDELNRALKERNDYIQSLQKQLGTSKKSYNARKGDEVDEMLAYYLEMFGTRVPVIRLGGGFYLFGTKKIYAKIMNGKLVVRVGGGYMIIDEFIANYEEPELNKLYKLCEKHGVDNINELDLEEITGIYSEKSMGGKSPGNRSPGGRASPGRASPKNRSFKATVGNAMNGSKRAPKLTANAIQNARQMN